MIEPGAGGALRSADGRVEVRVPGDALDAATTMSLREDPPPTAIGRERGIASFSLLAQRLSDGSPVTTFTKPVTIVGRYAAQDVRGLDAAALTVYVWQATTASFALGVASIPEPSGTPTATATATVTAMPSGTATPGGTAWSSPTVTATGTPTATPVPTSTPLPLATATPTSSAVLGTPPGGTVTPTLQPSPSPTPTSAATAPTTPSPAPSPAPTTVPPPPPTPGPSGTWVALPTTVDTAARTFTTQAQYPSRFAVVAPPVDSLTRPDATFGRTLSGERVGQHKVPPLVPVTIEITVALSTAVADATLSDAFPASWDVADAAGGTVAPVDETMSRISWTVGESAAGQTITRSYALVPPQRTTPPTRYTLTSSIALGSTVLESDPWTVVVADPTETTYLHAADVVLGSTTYNTVNPDPLAGTLATATAAIDSAGVQTFADGTVSIFASHPVPRGYQWDLGGTWTFTTYVRATAVGGDGAMRAQLSRIAPDGTATWLHTTGDDDANALANTSSTLMTWTSNVPAGTVLTEGERFGVALLLNVTTGQTGATAEVGFDTGDSPSEIVASITESAAASVREAHYRIGKDDGGPDTLTWYADTDTPATGILRDTNFRVRFQVYNNGAGNRNWQPQLEWSATPGAGYAPVPTTSGAAPFSVTATTEFANGDAIAAAALGTPGVLCSPCAWQNGVAYESENPPPTAIALNAFSFTEVEFNLQANSNAQYAASYAFRLSDAGADLDTYATEARITMALSVHDQNFLPTTDACAKCHRSHAAVGPSLLSAYSIAATVSVDKVTLALGLSTLPGRTNLGWLMRHPEGEVSADAAKFPGAPGWVIQRAVLDSDIRFRRFVHGSPREQLQRTTPPDPTQGKARRQCRENMVGLHPLDGRSGQRA